jgi:SAM-dependent methyltransferase
MTVFTLVYVSFNILFIAFVTKVPPVKTKRRDLKLIFSKLKVTPETVIYDLGCGGGNFLLEAIKHQPKKCIGYELSPMLYLEAVIKAKVWGQGKVEIKFQDFFKADLSEADLVYVYLVPPLLGKVAQKLKQDLRIGSIAVIKNYPLPDTKYIDKILLDAKRDYCVYIYKF